MNPGKLARITIDLALFVSLVLLTLNRFAPEYLNADTILNSVMSLQHITVFYWGQNRLANILPLAISPIRDPALNLYAYLFTAATVFYGMIWYWSDNLLKQGLPQPDNHTARRNIFLILVSVLFFTLRPYSIFEVVFWHIESTLSYLFLGVAFFYGLSASKPLWMLLAVIVPCLALAIGINYSIVVPALGLVAARLFLRRRPDARLIIFSALVLVLLIFWSFVAHNSQDPGPSYVGFDLGQLNGAVSIVCKNLVDAVYLGNVIVVLLAVCLLKVFSARFRSGGPTPESTQSGTLEILLFTFSAVWMLLFSINSWIAANAFAWRYFVPLIWVGIILFSLEVRGLAVSLSRRQHYALSVLLVAWLVFYLAQPFVSLRDYKVFKHTRAIVPSGVVGYAGDYWLVWPAVMQNLLDGRDGFGFTFRGEGNLQNLKQYYRMQERRNPALTIACLNESVERCCSKVKSYLGDVVRDGTKAVGDGVWLVDFHHDLARDGLMNAPLLDGEFALQLSANEVPPTWKSGTGIRCKIRIKNKADVALSSIGGDPDDAGRYAIRLSYRWVEDGSETNSLDGFDSRTPLPTLLRPNEEITLKMAIKAPLKPGKYWLEIEAVQELVAWFKDKGCPGIRIAVEVNK